jgi:hypothetical protein
MSPLRLITLEPAQSIYAGGLAAATRKIVRTPGLESLLEQARATAADKLPIPPDLRVAYLGQSALSHAFVEAHDFGMLQTYSGKTIPLIRQDWVKTVNVPVPAHELVPDLLTSMGIEPRDVLSALHASPSGAAYVDVSGDVVNVYAPNEPSLASLICTVHELGHYFYEIAGGRPEQNSFLAYMESEAAALAFCYVAVLIFLVEHGGGVPRDVETWEEYFRADMLLNHYFFLEESHCVGLFQGALPPIGMKFLRDNRTKLLGYQIVYAAASTLAAAHAWPIVDSLRNPTRTPSRMLRVVARTVGAAHLYPELSAA